MRLVCGIVSGIKALDHFAITPYVYFVSAKTQDIKGYGLGISWGVWAFYFIFTKGLPKDYPTFKILK